MRMGMTGRTNVEERPRSLIARLIHDELYELLSAHYGVTSIKIYYQIQ